MERESVKNLIQEYVPKEKWWELCSRFVEALGVNIFIVDSQGTMILPPEEERCGGRILLGKWLGFDVLYDARTFLGQFAAADSSRKRLRAELRFGLHCYALPMRVNGDFELAYVLVGPVILNQRLDDTAYRTLAGRYGIPSLEIPQLLNVLSEIRVLSENVLCSILDLLLEIIRSNFELTSRKNLETNPTEQEFFNHRNSWKAKRTAKELYSTLRMDELLVSFLDVALKLTNAEGGSIMVVDPSKGELVVTVFKGLDGKVTQKTRQKVGEGLAGLAAQKRASFLIDGKTIQEEIRHLLKRPEIKHSLVLPLMSNGSVFAVLNIHTTNPKSSIEEETIRRLQNLSELIVQ